MSSFLWLAFWSHAICSSLVFEIWRPPGGPQTQPKYLVYLRDLLASTVCAWEPQLAKGQAVVKEDLLMAPRGDLTCDTSSDFKNKHNLLNPGSPRSAARFVTLVCLLKLPCAIVSGFLRKTIDVPLLLKVQ